MNVIKFGATWCGPCKKIAPQVETLCKENNVQLKNVDVDTDALLSKQYKIRSLPTIVFLSPTGEELERVVGANIEAIDIAMKKSIKKSTPSDIPFSDEAEIRLSSTIIDAECVP